ncbi:MAG TPA: ribonuclease P protein component [Candidatus Dormibacteraeota bacterium]
MDGRSGRVRVSIVPTGTPWSRVAVAVVGARGAVERNRLRRQVRAASTAVMRELPGYDVVVQARAGGGAMRFEALVAAEKAALRQARARIQV